MTLNQHWLEVCRERLCIASFKTVWQLALSWDCLDKVYFDASRWSSYLPISLLADTVGEIWGWILAHSSLYRNYNSFRFLDCPLATWSFSSFHRFSTGLRSGNWLWLSVSLLQKQRVELIPKVLVSSDHTVDCSVENLRPIFTCCFLSRGDPMACVISGFLGDCSPNCLQINKLHLGSFRLIRHLSHDHPQNMSQDLTSEAPGKVQLMVILYFFH